MKHFIAGLVVAGALLPMAGVAFAQDAANGETVFRKCMACHRVGEGAKNAVGPALNGVIGRAAGTADGYTYSQLNRAAGENGLVWTDSLVLNYLEDPNAFLKKFLTEKGKPELATGSTKMVFKLPAESDRKDVIAYIKQFSPTK